MSAPKGTPAERRQRKESREASKKAYSQRQIERQESIARNKEKKAAQKERGKARTAAREASANAIARRERELNAGGSDPQSRLVSIVNKRSADEASGDWTPATGKNADLYNKLGSILSDSKRYEGLIKSATASAKVIKRTRSTRDKSGKLVKGADKYKVNVGYTLSREQAHNIIRTALVKTINAIEKGTISKPGKLKKGVVLAEMTPEKLNSYFVRTVMTQARISKSIAKAEVRTAEAPRVGGLGKTEKGKAVGGTGKTEKGRRVGGLGKTEKGKKIGGTKKKAPK